MRVLFESAKAVQEEDEEFRDHLRHAYQQSVRLANFCCLITDFGPQKTVKSLKEFNADQVLSPDALLEKGFREASVKWGTLQEGDISDDD